MRQILGTFKISLPRTLFLAGVFGLFLVVENLYLISTLKEELAAEAQAQAQVDCPKVPEPLSPNPQSRGQRREAR